MTRIFLALLLLCAASAEAKESIKPSLESQKMAGALGSADGAFKVAQYYFKVDPVEYKYWIDVAAENGHPVAEYNRAKLLLEDKRRPQSKQRAIFWLKKSSSHGFSEATLLLKEIDK